MQTRIFITLIGVLALSMVSQAQPTGFTVQPTQKVYRKFFNPLIKDTAQTTMIVKGRVYIGGDIYVGTEQEMDRFQFMQLSVTNDASLTNGRWENGIVHFTIENGFTFAEETIIINAMNHIAANTNVCFKRRTTQGSYLKFKKYTVEELGFSGGSSFLGKCNSCFDGQEIKISAASDRVVRHEICHALGLLHEQSREDRDRFITINYDNILPFMGNNFDKAVFSSTDVGSYDFSSIMHYFSTAFGKTVNNVTLQTIVRRSNPSDNSFGFSNVLSAGDIAGINRMYPVSQPCTTLQPSMKVGELGLGESRTVTVNAKTQHNLTGIFLRLGQSFKFEVIDNSWSNGSTRTTCAGYEGGPLDGLRRYGNFKMFSLVGELFKENSTSEFLNVSIGIGCAKTYDATKSGYLVAFANDVLGVGYGDNSGSISLKVTRIL